MPSSDSGTVQDAIDAINAFESFDPALLGIIARTFPDYRILTDLLNVYALSERRIKSIHDDWRTWFRPDECLAISAIRVGFPRLFYQIIRNEIPLGELISQCIDSSADNTSGDYETRVANAYDEFSRAVPPFVRECFPRDPRCRYLSINYLLYMADWEGDLTGAAWVVMNSSKALPNQPVSDVDAHGIITCFAPREWTQRIAYNKDFLEYVCNRLPGLDGRLHGKPGQKNTVGEIWTSGIEQMICESLLNSLRPSASEAADISVYCSNNPSYLNLRAVYAHLLPSAQQRLMTKVLGRIFVDALPPVANLSAEQQAEQRPLEEAKAFAKLTNDLYTNSEMNLDTTFSHYLTESDAGTCRNGMLLRASDPEDVSGLADPAAYATREERLCEYLRTHPDDVRALNDLGVLHVRMRLFSAAESELKRALKAGKDDDSAAVCSADATADATSPFVSTETDRANGTLADNRLIAAVHNNLGVMYAIENRFDEAQHELEQSLRKYRGETDDRSRTAADDDSQLRSDLGMVLNNLGAFDIKIEQFDDARNHLDEALQLFDGDVAHVMNEFGKLDISEANARAEHVERELEQHQFADERTKLAIAMVLNNGCNLSRRTSALHRAQVESEVACHLVNTLAEDIRVRYPNSHAYDPYKAAVLNNFGSILRRRKRKTEIVESTLGEALRIYRELAELYRHTGIDMFRPDVAMVLNNLGNMYGDNDDRLSDAQRALREALNVRDSMAGAGAADPDAAMMHNNLGVICCKMSGQFNEAREHLEEAHLMRSELAQSSSPIAQAVYQPRVADAENNLGNLYMQARAFQNAEREYLSALVGYTALAVSPQEGAYLPRKAMALNNLGVLYIRAGRLGEAETRLCESRREYDRLLEKVAGETFKPRKAMVLNNLGDLYRLLDRHEDAKDCLEQAREIYIGLTENDRDKYRSSTAMTLDNLCVLYQDQIEDGDVSLDTIREALKDCVREMLDVCKDEPWRVAPFSTLSQMLERKAEADKANATLDEVGAPDESADRGKSAGGTGEVHAGPQPGR